MTANKHLLAAVDQALVEAQTGLAILREMSPQDIDPVDLIDIIAALVSINRSANAIAAGE